MKMNRCTGRKDLEVLVVCKLSHVAVSGNRLWTALFCVGQATFMVWDSRCVLHLKKDVD